MDDNQITEICRMEFVEAVNDVLINSARIGGTPAAKGLVEGGRDSALALLSWHIGLRGREGQGFPPGMIYLFAVLPLREFELTLSAIEAALLGTPIEDLGEILKSSMETQ